MGITSPLMSYAYLSFHGVGKWCAVAFFQLFYRNRKIVKRCSVGINKADLFLDSAYPAAPASFRNYGSIADFSAFVLSVVLVGIELKKQKNSLII